MTDGPDEDPLAHLDFEVEEPDVEDISKLTDFELSLKWGQVREELYSLGEMMSPPELRSERGKELHSQFIAIQVEMHRRKW